VSTCRAERPRSQTLPRRDCSDTSLSGRGRRSRGAGLGACVAAAPAYENGHVTNCTATCTRATANCSPAAPPADPEARTGSDPAAIPMQRAGHPHQLAQRLRMLTSAVRKPSRSPCSCERGWHRRSRSTARNARPTTVTSCTVGFETPLVGRVHVRAEGFAIRQRSRTAGPDAPGRCDLMSAGSKPSRRRVTSPHRVLDEAAVGGNFG